jgi:hypothetical protein
MKSRPMYLKLEIDGYQEDKIVAESIKVSYLRLKSTKHSHEWPPDRDALLKSFRCIYHYYTGKTLK